MKKSYNHLFFIFLTLISLTFFVLSNVSAQMKAGVAKTIITNKESRLMVNSNMSEGVLHDLYARALVLNDGSNRLVILTYDLNCLDVATPILRQRVQKELAINPSRLILLATHNHSAPIQINPENFDYGRWLADKMFALIQEAITNETGSVELFYGFGNGYFLINIGNAPIDYEIQVLKVTKEDKPIAILFNQPTHAIQASDSLIEVGHPGYAVEKIEAEFPGVLAMYGDACGANQAPEGVVDERTLYNAGLEKAKAVGHKLAQKVIQIANAPMEEVTGAIKSELHTISLPLAPPIAKEQALKLAKRFPKDVGFVPYPHALRGTNWVRMLLRYYKLELPFPQKTTDMICTDDTYLIHKDDKPLLKKYDYSIHKEYPCVYEEVIVTQIGKLSFIAMQGEICAPIGMRIKDAFRKDKPVMVFGYMGEHNLYIPTRELVRLDAYQARTIQIQYGSPVGWAPEVEDEMVYGVIKLVKSSIDVE